MFAIVCTGTYMHIGTHGHTCTRVWFTYTAVRRTWRYANAVCSVNGVNHKAGNRWRYAIAVRNHFNYRSLIRDNLSPYPPQSNITRTPWEQEAGRLLFGGSDNGE